MSHDEPRPDPRVPLLGPATRQSPCPPGRRVPDDLRALASARVVVGAGLSLALPDGAVAFELAGPRQSLFFDPARVRAGILTAGGTCPGTNDVIRAAVLELHHGYGVRDVLGIRHGFDGLAPGTPLPPIALGPAEVASIHELGGTLLGTARGRHPVEDLAAEVTRLGLDVLLCIGGDGTLRGTAALDEALRQRGTTCAVVGIPKTIDNDVSWCSRTFGFDTAVTEAARSVRAAHVEAHAHRNGIGLVKLMGRDSGFIAAHAALACPEANFVLVPEVPFPLDGEKGLVAALRARLARRGHAVIVVAEGAGQEHFEGRPEERDASGNLQAADIGAFLARELPARLAAAGTQATLKYFDPSYDVRAVRASAPDAILCGQLGKAAVHAALSGRTGLFVSLLGDELVHVPLALVRTGRKRIDPQGALWRSVLESCG